MFIFYFSLILQPTRCVIDTSIQIRYIFRFTNLLSIVVMPALAIDIVCCSMASWIATLSCSLILSNYWRKYKLIENYRYKELEDMWYTNITVQYTAAHSTLQYSTVQYSTLQYSTLQHSTVKYSTLQHSTVQLSTVQLSAVHYSTSSMHITPPSARTMAPPSK